MALHKRPEYLSEVDLLSLIDNGVQESRTLDYKLLLKPNDKKELLADISSFANASGGYLLIGIQEEKGVPVAVPGVSLDDPDGEVLRLSNLLRDGVEPRIPGVTVRAVTLSNGNYVLAIHIPKSWAAPHVVTVDKHYRFYGRTSAGKYPLDAAELRQAFLMSDSLSEKIRHFHTSRVMAILANEGPRNLADGPRFIVHAIPISSFGGGAVIDVGSLQGNGLDYTPLAGGGYSSRYNLDGFCTYSDRNDGQSVKTLSYLQIFRTGILETVYVEDVRGGETAGLAITHYEREQILFMKRMLALLEGLQVDPPYVCMLTIAGVKNQALYIGGLHYFSHDKKFDRDILSLPDLVVEDVVADEGKFLRPWFDGIWNAAGWPRARTYDETGKWTGFIR